MLKAYIVSENVNHENSALVFAESPSKAKLQALGTDNLCDYNYINLRAKRAQYADGKENASARDLMVLNIQNGWWYEIDGQRIDSDNLEEALVNGLI